MPYCKDGRFHRTQAEADACLHHPADKDFKTVNLPHPPLSTGKSRNNIEEDQHSDSEEEDENDSLPTRVPVTPLAKKKSKAASKSPSPASQQPGYPTPPFTQEMEDIGDNIVVASSSPAAAAGAARRRSPRPAPSCGMQAGPSSSRAATPEAELDDFDDIPGPLSSTAPTRSPSPAQAPSNGTTRVPETDFEGTTLINDNDDDQSDEGEPNIADLENSIRTLTADRAHLTDALHDSTFHVRRLQTRGRIERINTALARQENASVLASARAAWETVEVAAEARRNAWTSTGIVLGVAVAYWVWCWWMSVEMAYIRSRRCGVFGMGPDC